MKTTNILKTLILSITILTATSCKKEEVKPTPQPKTYMVEYRGYIYGTSVSGQMLFWNPETKKTETETVFGGSILKTFVFTEGSYATATLNANVTSGYATANLEVYVNNKKLYSASQTKPSLAYVYIHGAVN